MQKNIDWLFDVGQVVHFHDMTATVVHRSLTAMGQQLYTIKVSGEAYGRPERFVMGDALVAA